MGSNMSTQWVLASNNPGKLSEIQQILVDLEIELIPQQEFGVEEVEETGLSFIENSILKARHASEQTGLPAIADDSGIEVSALKGEPGIYSARYALNDDYSGELDVANLNKLLKNMQHQTNRQARFVCAITLIKHNLDPTPAIFEGFWEGEISHQPSGKGGFGYDPIFFLKDQNCTSAEISAELKAKLSHRGQALEKLKRFLENDINALPYKT
jgi:XTP/dITP diphosphohydrolase